MTKLLEEILKDGNIQNAVNKVCTNKGASGIDGVSVEELKDCMKQNWNRIKEEISKREYKPQPVRRVEIPK